MKVEQLKAELVVFKGLMSNVSLQAAAGVLLEWWGPGCGVLPQTADLYGKASVLAQSPVVGTSPPDRGGPGCSEHRPSPITRGIVLPGERGGLAAVCLA